MVLSKLARQINDSRCHAEDEKLFIGCSMLLNMTLRAAVILERNYSIQQVMDLEPQDRARIVQAARYVVEHSISSRRCLFCVEKNSPRPSSSRTKKHGCHGLVAITKMRLQISSSKSAIDRIFRSSTTCPKGAV